MIGFKPQCAYQSLAQADRCFLLIPAWCQYLRSLLHVTDSLRCWHNFESIQDRKEANCSFACVGVGEQIRLHCIIKAATWGVKQESA